MYYGTGENLEQSSQMSFWILIDKIKLCICIPVVFCAARWPIYMAHAWLVNRGVFPL